MRLADGREVTFDELKSAETMRAQEIELSVPDGRSVRMLISIKGSTKTLLNASRALDRAETREFIRIIDQQADHMQGLIGDLLDAGRIDAGTLPVDPEPLEVAALSSRRRPRS